MLPSWFCTGCYISVTASLRMFLGELSPLPVARGSEHLGAAARARAAGPPVHWHRPAAVGAAKKQIVPVKRPRGPVGSTESHHTVQERKVGIAEWSRKGRATSGVHLVASLLLSSCPDPGLQSWPAPHHHHPRPHRH